MAAEYAAAPAQNVDILQAEKLLWIHRLTKLAPEPPGRSDSMNQHHHDSEHCPEITETSLSASSLFRNVDLDFLIDRLQRCERRYLEPDECLIQEGQKNATLYIVLSGNLQAKLCGSDDSCVVTELGVGDCVGEMSVLDDRPATATVTASAPTWLLEIPRDLIWTLIDRTTYVSRNLLYVLAGRLRRGNLTLRENRDELSRLAVEVHTDPLTGLRNRRWFDEHLLLAIEQCERQGDELSIIALDIDHFKTFNDDWGHQVGDTVLRQVAADLVKTAGEKSHVARTGGEEFTIIVEDLGEANAAALANKLRKAVAAAPPLTANGQTIPQITISLGVTEWQSGQSVNSLCASADRALYMAKDAGRNCVQCSGNKAL